MLGNVFTQATLFHNVREQYTKPEQSKQKQQILLKSTWKNSMADVLKTLSGDIPLGLARTLNEEPETTLVNWQIFEARWHRTGHFKTIHFVGDSLGLAGGRVSSSIQKFDKSTMQGISRSGRIYRLSGPPGQSHEAEKLWEDWQFKFGAPEVKCITDKYLSIPTGHL